MADNQLQVILDEQNVAKDNAQLLIKAFGAPFTEAGEILAEYQTIVVTDEEQFDLMAEARSKRLKLKEIRVGVEHKRKELKEDSLRTGRAIDSVAKYVKDTIEPAETYLEKQEKYAEIKQAERKAKVHSERIEELSKYVEDVSLYALEDMTDEAYKNLLAGAKQAQADKKALEAKAERERIAREKAEAEEQERIRLENVKLKKEAELKEIEREKERAAELKIQAAKDAELEAERKKRQALVDAENARKAKEETEARLAKEAEEEAKRNELLSPDRDKLIRFAEALDTIRVNKLPAVKSNQAQEVVNNIEKELQRLSNLIVEKARQM